MKKKVYISSTYKDLVTYRDAIRDMFLSKGLEGEYDLISMEGYVSESGKKAIDVCLEDVRNTDIYILILAKRYGSLVEDQNISYTEAEYDEAVVTAKKNPQYKIFVFYSSEETEAVDFGGVKNIDNINLDNFYKKALSQHASFINAFSNPDNLCKQILLTFSYSFKKPSGINDYKEALMLIDRNDQSYAFSRSVKKNSNSFFFTSVYDNSPNDFLERLYDMEMGGKYRKCRIDLAQFSSIDYEKFRQTFVAELCTQWADDKAEYIFDADDKLFLSVEINSIEAGNDNKLANIGKVLTEFLPRFLTTDGNSTTGNRVFFIFYTYLQNENPVNEKFNTLIKDLQTTVKISCGFNAINSLNDITKTDARSWLDTFLRDQEFDENDIDDMLQVGGNPFKTFKMKEINRLLKNWIKANLFNN